MRVSSILSMLHVLWVLWVLWELMRQRIWIWLVRVHWRVLVGLHGPRWGRRGVLDHLVRVVGDLWIGVRARRAAVSVTALIVVALFAWHPHGIFWSIGLLEESLGRVGFVGGRIGMWWVLHPPPSRIVSTLL